MGDIDVDFFLGTLNNLIADSKNKYIKYKKHQLESLAEDIKYLREFLRLTDKKRKEQSEVMDLVVRIRDVVSEAENIVELFVVHVYKADYSNQYGLSLDLESVKKKIKTLGVEVKGFLDVNGGAIIKRKHSSTESEEGPSSSGGRDTYKVGNEGEVVGFEGEVASLLGKLHHRGDGGELEIISIIGPGGGGKTTLAREVYNHPLTKEQFEIRAWVNVPQYYNETMKGDLLLSILKSAFPEDHKNYLGDHEDYKEIKDDMLSEKRKEWEDNLGQKLLQFLKKKKFLIVMDDIWEVEAWNDMQRSFPRENNGSKVMLTSRQPIQQDRVGCIPHVINLLPDSSSWELLQKKVFKKGQCPQVLVHTGWQIAKKCQGLPLAIIAIAGILAKEDQTINAWKEVGNHLSSIIAKSQEGTLIMELLELSYNHLPLHLKACFLYIGAHQEDYEIPVRKLIGLWIAEGFIHQMDCGKSLDAIAEDHLAEGFIHQMDKEKSLEAIAEDHLIDLIERNLITVARNWAGTIKACRIHDLLRELCITKGKEENFFVQKYDGTKKYRRLFTDKELHKFYSSSCAGNLRSFSCPAYGTDFPFFAERFKLLRVLNIMNKYRQIGGLQKGDLIHLRYLALLLDEEQNWDASFTQIFRNLLNLEILELDFDGDMLVPPDVLKMVRLKNLYSKSGRYMFHHNYEYMGKENILESLQILRSICSCEYCLHFLERAPKLRKLKIKENWISIPLAEMNLTSGLFSCDLEFLKCLEVLHFCGNVHLMRWRTVELKLPPTITRLALSHISFEWEHLSILLQNLPRLEVLKLSSNKSIGRIWNTNELEDNEEGFSKLKYLKLCDMDIKEWSASEDNFPRLEVLVIERCQFLKAIPIDFANLCDLREIKVEHSTRSAEESARKIQEEHKDRNDACLKLVATLNWHRDEFAYDFLEGSSDGYSRGPSCFHNLYRAKEIMYSQHMNYPS